MNLKAGDIVGYEYGFIWYDIKRYLPPLTRLFTGRLFNHGALVIDVNGILMLAESDDKGVVVRPLLQYLNRTKSKIVVYEPTVNYDMGIVANKALMMCGRGYDYVSLPVQLVYRITQFISWCANNFIGKKKYSGIWIGNKNAKRLGCFEFIYECFGWPESYKASGWEFTNRNDFKIIYSDL